MRPGVPSRGTRRAWLRQLGAQTVVGLGLAGPQASAEATAAAGQAGAGGALSSGPNNMPQAPTNRRSQHAGALEQSPSDPVRRGRPLVFPRDHGAHLGSRIEWWYVTGWLHSAAEARASSGADTPSPGLMGFQITFFRSRTGLAEGLPGRLAPRHLLFAHAALTDLGVATHQHDARLARWSGRDETGARVRAAMHDADLAVHGWRMQREVTPERWVADISARSFSLRLDMAPTQPLLLQGQAGFSRKGPQEAQASHYVSAPHLAVSGQVRRDGRAQQVGGRAWLDHEWSDELLHPEAVGWDWIGMNLDDGSALTAFRLRRADGSALWAGGSFRAAGSSQAQDFAPESVVFQPGRRWRSASSGGDYPVTWTVQTPAGRFTVQALLDAQELDSRSSTGTVYWEGLCALKDDSGRQRGLGYLEMTGYAGRLQL